MVVSVIAFLANSGACKYPRLHSSTYVCLLSYSWVSTPNTFHRLPPWLPIGFLARLLINSFATHGYPRLTLNDRVY